MSTTHTQPDEATDGSGPAEQVDPPRLSLDGLRLPSPRVLAAGAVAIAVAAGGLLAWSPWDDGSGDGDRAARTVAAREAALDAATEGMLAFNTVDHDQVAATVDSWLEASGGALHREVRRDRSKIAARARKAATDSRAEVVRTAIAAFDAEAGTATVLGVLTIRTDPPRGKDRSRTSRFRVLVQRLDADWKLTYLETVGAGA